MENNNTKLIAFKLDSLEQEIYYSFLSENNIKTNKELINKLILDNVINNAYEKLITLKGLK